MPLQNRVNPFGDICANPARGLMMGNRGIIHDHETKTLTHRRWAIKQWIICTTDLRAHRGPRKLMGPGSYTELFFLDEVTALSAGHRPCFQCRYKAAKAYQAAWQKAHNLTEAPKIAEIDPVLHAQRLEKKQKRLHQISKRELIDGCMILVGDQILALKKGNLLKWTFDGYQPSGVSLAALPEEVNCLTPPATVKTMSHGYLPIWHESAETAL